MLFLVLQASLGLAALYFAKQVINLLRNLQICRNHSIPAVILPLDPLSIAGTVLGDPLHVFLSTLPNWLQPACTNFLHRGWYYEHDLAAWKELGPVWAFASPGGVHVQVADPAAGLEILERRDRSSDGNGFVRPEENYQVLALFGPCLSTADNLNWPRHRKVLAAPFNESVMSATWRESLKQATQLVTAWSSVNEVPFVGTDLRTLSLNVLAGAGFKKGVDFQSAMTRSQKSSSGQPMGYRDALQVVLDNYILLMLVPYQWLRKFTWSSKCTYIGNAATSFEQHMLKMLDEEERLVQEGAQGAGGIMTALVKAVNPSLKSHRQPGMIPRGLSREEVCGNIFVLNFAGHDTTANTLTFAALLLIAYPDVQDWVAEELRDKITYPSDASSWQYNDYFSELQRIRALMLETLRLFPPIGLLPKATRTKAQTLNLGLRPSEISVPSRAIVNVGVLALQTSTELWGADALQFKPSRWLQQTSDGQRFIEPRPGSFLAWSAGPQNCPGSKFSEVEFVAVMARLLVQHRLEAVPLDNESSRETLRRVKATVENIDKQVLAKVKHGDAVHVRLAKR